VGISAARRAIRDKGMPFRVHALDGACPNSARKAAVRLKANLRAVLGRETVIGSVFKAGADRLSCRFGPSGCLDLRRRQRFEGGVPDTVKIHTF